MPLYFESYRTPVDGNGDPYPGAKLYFYDEATVTPKDTFTTRALSVANANPVIADGNGRFGPMWLSTGRYKAVLKTAADVTLYTADGIEGTDAGFGILTTRGDLLTRNATSAIRLAIGANGTVLGSNGTDPGWVTGPSLSSVNVWTAVNTFQLTDDGVGAGPVLDLKRISASPAASDGLGVLRLVGRDDGSNDINYVQFGGNIVDPAAASKDSSGFLTAYTANTSQVEVNWGAGVAIGNATGGRKGYGTINATNYYKNDVEVLNSGVVAWVNSDAVGGIQSSYNVSSVVVNGTGDYTINFTTALANADYASVGTGEDISGQAQVTVGQRIGDLHSTTQLQIRTARGSAPVSGRFSLAVYAG